MVKVFREFTLWFTATVKQMGFKLWLQVQVSERYRHKTLTKRLELAD